MTILVPLTRGLSSIIDDCDADLVLQFKWMARRSTPSVHYAVRYLTVDGKKTIIHLHRLLIGAPVGLEVDHINHDGLDNRRENLRLSTRSQNAANARHRVGISGYRGVVKNGPSWRAAITLNRRVIYGPQTKCKLEAARYYDRVARELHGEFAILNFPEEQAA